METLTIGKLANKAQVNVQTVRYYERRGLLTPFARRESGYREFSPVDVLRIRFIKNAQQLGFTLSEITDLLALHIAEQSVCESVKGRAETKIEEIKNKVADLQKMRRTLQSLVQACDSRTVTNECPILEAFSEDA